eukprot:12596704-Alexandrium_andersonii.AAC.1
MERNDQPRRLGCGRNDDAGPPKADRGAGQGGEVVNVSGGGRPCGKRDGHDNRVKAHAPEEGLDGPAHSSARVDRARHRGA